MNTCMLLALLALVGIVSGDQAAITKGKAWLDKVLKEDGVVKLPSGLQFKVVRHGTGPSPKKSTTCDVHYRGTLPDGTEFDSSYSRGAPTPFASTQVIKGFGEALVNMREGDKWEIFIPYDLAYGERGSPPKIPGYSPLKFEFELVKVKGKALKAVKSKKRLINSLASAGYPEDVLKNIVGEETYAAVKADDTDAKAEM